MKWDLDLGQLMSTHIGLLAFYERHHQFLAGHDVSALVQRPHYEGDSVPLFISLIGPRTAKILHVGEPDRYRYDLHFL